MKRSWFLLLPFSLMAGLAWADKPQVQWNPDYDFSSIRTFAWDESQVTLENANPFLHRQIVNAIEQELTERGWVRDENDPDVHVTYFGSADRAVFLQPSATSYDFGNYGTPGWDHSGYGSVGPVYNDTRIVEIGRGSLIVDFWDASDRALIWRGSVDDIDVSADSSRTARNAEKAIRKLAKHAEELRKQSSD